MPSKRLTDLSIQNLGVASLGTRFEYSDVQQPGLVLRVTDRGRKSFSAYFYLGEQHYRLTLGPYPDLSLADDRAKAEEVRRTAGSGGDPRVEQNRARAN